MGAIPPRPPATFWPVPPPPPDPYLLDDLSRRREEPPVVAWVILALLVGWCFGLLTAAVLGVGVLG